MAEPIARFPARSSRTVARVIRGRWRLLLAMIVVVGLVASAWQWNRPGLSVAERQLVGAWGLPELCTPRDMGVPAGPMTNPYHVIELTPDRVYRFWFASADNLSQRYLIQEGRWRIDKGRLLIEDMPITSPRRITDDLVSWNQSITGLSLRALRLYTLHRVRVPSSETFRFAGPSQLEITGDLKTLTWNRLPGWNR